MPDIEDKTPLLPSLPLKFRRYRTRRGRCYELSFTFILDNCTFENIFLIHGTILQLDKRFYNLAPMPALATKIIEHAWVEVEGIYYDPVDNTWFTKKDYCKYRDAQIKHRYTPEQAARLCTKYNHSGPWK